MTDTFDCALRFEKANTSNLKNIDLECRFGRVLGLIGKRGSGKTSLISLALGLVRKLSGSVRVLGAAKPGPDRIGVVTANASFPFSVSAAETDFVLKKIYKNHDSIRFNSLIDGFGFAKNIPLGRLSVSERVAVSLAAALSHRPRLAFFDATEELDRAAVETLLAPLKEYAKTENAAVIVTSDRGETVRDLIDDCALLADGKIIIKGALGEVENAFVVAEGNKSDISALPEDRIIARLVNDFGGEALMRKDSETELPARAALTVRPASIDDILRFGTAGELK